MAQLKKADLIKILVEDYGYEKEDIKMLTNGKLQAIIKQEKQDEEELNSLTNKMVEKATMVKDDDLINIMSGTSGSFFHQSQQTGRSWRFTNFGQIDRMPFRELLTINNVSPRTFTDGYIVILDKTVQGEFGLTEMYKNILTPDNLEELFKKSIEEMEVFINGLPEAMKMTFVDKAREMYENKTLDSASKLDFIQNKFNFSFKDNAPLDDIV